MHTEPATQINGMSDFLEMELDLLKATLIRKSQKNSQSEKGLNFLVVDDDYDMLQYVGSSLLSAYEQAEIIYANNGSQAMEQMQHLVPDLIITDWDMPGLNGLELAKALKSDSHKRGIPILLVTGIELSKQARLRISELGICSVLSKPFNAEKLLGLVRQLLNEHPSSTEP